jgi:hypothetical protein
MNPDFPEFSVKVENMFKHLNNHMLKEESEDIPLICKMISYDDRIIAGQRFERRKTLAPSRPHMNMPDNDPERLTVASLLLESADKYLDHFQSFPTEKEMIEIKTMLKNYQTVNRT